MNKGLDDLIREFGKTMSVGSVSFWQQDQNYWNQSQSQSQNSDAVITTISSAMTSLSSGLASIYNQEALTRTNNALTAAIQSELQQTQSASSTGSSSGSEFVQFFNKRVVVLILIGVFICRLTGNRNRHGAAHRKHPAVDPANSPNSAITVSDGTQSTTYTTTGTDTVTNLIGAINANVYGNAQVTHRSTVTAIWCSLEIIIAIT